MAKTIRKFKDRFQKFYHLNKERLIKERKAKYIKKKKLGLCVRCKKKAVGGTNFCQYHRDKQREYNQNRVK